MTEAMLRAIPRPVRGRVLHKLLWKKLRIPRALVHPALSTAKSLASPGEVARRRKLAEALAGEPPALGVIAPERGFLLPPPGSLPGTAAAIDRCREIFEVRRRAPDADRIFNPSKQGFLLAVRSGDDFAAHPDLVRFMVSRPVLDCVTRYLGAVPLLAGAALWWSPPNQSASSSQLYHLDNEDRRQVKVFVNLQDTTAAHGPFTFLPADVSKPAVTALRQGRGRLDDALVERRVGLGEERSLVGPAGSTGLVDTSRCLHYGSRANSLDRLVLVFQFLRFESPTESTFGFRRPPVSAAEGLDTYQRLAIGVEPD